MGRVFRFAQRVLFRVGGLPWLGLSILAVLTLSSVLPGQISQDSQAVVHLPTDWSHHHLVFSNPATEEQLKRVQQDPRYWQQLFRRSQAAPPEADLDGAFTSESQPGSKTSHANKNHKLKRDWTKNMGTGATVGAGQYPGKFGFDVTQSSCANDFVVFNTSLPGGAGQASIIAYNNLYSGCSGFGTVPSGYWAYNTNGGTISTSVTLSVDGTQMAFVQAPTGGGGATLVLLKWAQDASSTAFSPAQLTISTSNISVTGCSWGLFFSTTVTCTGGNFTAAFDVGAPITGGGLPAGDTITAVNSSTQITVSRGTLFGGSGTLTITPQNTTAVAASGCSWNGVTNSTVTCTSGGFASADVGAALVLNDGFPNNETITAVNSPTNVTVSPALPKTGTGSSGSGASGSIYAHSLVSPSNYRSCAAPCMTSITLNGSPTVAYSAPFYDFSGSDTLYVGDDTGKLHQFTGVFLGTPAETTTGYPVTVASAQLSSPIYDSTTGKVFVASSFQVSDDSGARLHAVCATSKCGTVGTVTASGILGPTASGSACHGTGASGDGSNMRLDSPIIDPVAGMVYVFLGNDGNGKSAVVQLPMGFSNQACGTEALIGTASTTGIPVFAGTFDNLYINSSGGTPPGSSPSGNLYVCGDTSTSGDATLYQVQIVSNVMTTSGTSRPVSSAATTCSPVTEVYNTPNDYIFLSVETHGAPANCSGAGCVMSYTVPTVLGAVLPLNTTATATESGGTSGIVIDNIINLGSEIYFSTLTGSNAVQVSQSALQ